MPACEYLPLQLLLVVVVLPKMRLPHAAAGVEQQAQRRIQQSITKPVHYVLTGGDDSASLRK
jgi:hypothetical protein